MTIKINRHLFSITDSLKSYIIKHLETNKIIVINKYVYGVKTVANLAAFELTISRTLNDNMSKQVFAQSYHNVMKLYKQTYIKNKTIKPIKIKQYIKSINIPQNVNLTLLPNQIFIQNKEKLSNCLSIIVPNFFNYSVENNKLTVTIKEFFRIYEKSRALFNTMLTKLIHQIKGISELYRGVINIQGLGYSVAVTKLAENKYNLFFRFGFKDKFNYIMPNTITIENPETAKTKLLINTYSLELLKQTQLNIQRFRYPKAYKLQGIYLNDTYPTVKKFVK